MVLPFTIEYFNNNVYHNNNLVNMHYKFTNVIKINKEETRLLTENALIIYPIKPIVFWIYL